MAWIKNPDEPEKIICAAIHYDDGNDYGSQPDNIESGFVIGTRRHDAGIGILHGLGYKPKGNHVTQGFITTHNRFLNRKESAKVAFKASQCDEKRVLFSEDIY